ncbi:MAG TPA: sigma 54-interacting transcriptional regulator [Blastocatellia bacterium]|jgi:formate hydrogenlyase transcriptional activator|nr:sigma 54-interacting transcriptional regulator [Blastocatellia bacterium]
MLRQYRGLLEITEVIATHRDLSSLFHDLAERLSLIVQFDLLGLSLYDPARNLMRLRLLETPASDLPAPPEEFPIEGSLAGWVWQTQKPLLIADVAQESSLPVDIIRRHGFKSCCALPLTSSARRLGAMVFGSLRPERYVETDLAFLEQVTKQVAVAIDNALNSEQLARERDRSQLLLEVNNAAVATRDLRELLAATAASLRRLMRRQCIGLFLYDSENERLQIHALDFAEGTGTVREGMSMPVEECPAVLALRARRPVPVSRREIEEQFDSEYVRRMLDDGVKSGCGFPLIAHGRLLGALGVLSLTEETFPPEEIELLKPIADQIAIAVENALAFQQIVELANKLTEEKFYLEDEIRTDHNFEQIIGESLPLKRVLKQVETVAPADSTVLIIGETGAGKELIARAIHNLSARRERTLVKLNCAAIPTGLLESEMFGHEKGAFTGAMAQRIGRFELAHRGTLFLDEIGDIPLELQPKLLRVLQEQEFERLGSSRTLRADVRLVAATNCDLAQMVSDKQFRSDLYYRLNVFPITLPPLRERGDDIVLLSNYFVQKFSQRFKKKINSIGQRSLDRLREYTWPGNIRELENFIERAVLLSEDETLTFDSPFNQNREPNGRPTATSSQPALLTLDEMERDYIIEVMRRTNGMIAGKGGAAEILGLPPSTLRSRMKKLGIK